MPGTLALTLLFLKDTPQIIEQGSLEVPGKITFCNSNEKIIEGIKEA